MVMWRPAFSPSQQKVASLKVPLGSGTGVGEGSTRDRIKEEMIIQF